MVEILKQPQFKPMNVIDQVMVIFAGTKGYLDKVPRQAGAGVGGAVPALHATEQRRCATPAEGRSSTEARRRRSDRRRRHAVARRGSRQQAPVKPACPDAADHGVKRRSLRPVVLRARFADRAARAANVGCEVSTHGQHPRARQPPQGDPQHPQDHADDGADRHGALQEGAGPGHARRRPTRARSPSWPPTSAPPPTNVSHPLLEKRERGQEQPAAGASAPTAACAAATTPASCARPTSASASSAARA